MMPKTRLRRVLSLMLFSLASLRPNTALHSALVYLLPVSYLTACGSSKKTNALPRRSAEDNGQRRDPKDIGDGKAPIDGGTRIEPDWVKCEFKATPGVEGFDVAQEGKEVRCGNITVPESRSKASARQVALHFAKFTLPNSDDTKPPIIIHFGGPGDTGQGPFWSAKEIAKATNRTVVIMGQRGTYFSNHIRLSAECNKGVHEGKQECIDDVNRRYDLPSYNTTEAVADTYDLMVRALGYKKIVLYGVSYGTYYSLRFMATHPDLVEYSILDSVSSPDHALVRNAFDSALTYNNIEMWLAQAHRNVCRLPNNHGYAFLCPSLNPYDFYSAKIWTAEQGPADSLRTFLLNDQVPAAAKVKLFSWLRTLSMYHTNNGEIALSVLAGWVEGGQKFQSRLNAVEISMKRTSGDNSFDIKALLDPAGSDESLFSGLMNKVTRCNDVDRWITKPKLEAAFNNVVKGGARLSSNLVSIIDEGTCLPGLAQSKEAPSEALGLPPAHMGNKTFILNAAIDAATSAHEARVVHEALNGSFYFESSCSSHGVIAGSGKEPQIIAGLLNGSLRNESALRQIICGETGFGLTNSETEFVPRKKLVQWWEVPKG